MNTNRIWELNSQDPVDTIDVICATDITDTRLCYTFSATTNETVVLCGDNDRIVGWPNKKAKAGASFKLRRYGDIKAVAAVAFAANNFPITAAAGGKIRKAVIGTDLQQGFNNSTATGDGSEFTVSRV